MEEIMKKLFVLGTALLLILSLGLIASAKTLKLGLDADPKSIDIHEQRSGGTLQFSHWVFDPLVRYAQDMSFEPRLAKRWERIDKNTMRFHLVKGVKFHSGNDFTAEDVQFTLNRLKTSVDFKGLFELFSEPVIVDKYTVDIVTTKPYGLVLNMMTYIFPLDKKFYTGTDDKGTPKDAVVKVGHSFAKTAFPSGTGAFKLTHRDHGVKLVLERNENYWDIRSPGNVDKVIFTPIAEAATRVAALLSGDVDFISPVPPQDFKRIQKDSKVDLVTFSGGRIITVQLNQKKNPALANVKVRQAIAYAVNNVGIAKKIMKGTATPAGGTSPHGYSGFSPDLKPRYNLEKAKQLMKEAGYANGFTASMMAPNNRYVNDAKIAETFTQMVAKIGIKVNLKTMPKAQYWDRFDERAADILMIGWHSDTEDSGNFYEFLAMCPDTKTGYGQYNSGNYCNKEVDKLTIAAQTETNFGKRTAMLKRAEKLIYDEAAYITFHWQNHSYGVKNGVNALPIVNAQNFPYLGDLVIK
jgi:peptide/nickel transport system substrate-binding protein